MSKLPHSLDRSVVIHAPRAVVFRHFTDSDRFARWWGPGSTIEAKAGGAVQIVHQNGVVVRGAVAKVDPDRGIAFTYGYEDPGKPIRVGGSLVTIALQDHADGTLLQLQHGFAAEAVRDQHVPGWRFQLAVLANAVANEQHARVATAVDQWFYAWAEAEAGPRTRMLAACSTDDVTLQDPWSCLRGRDELSAHIAACMVHAPGTKMERVGEPRHCQGTVLVDWTATDAAGNAKGKGTNVVRLAPDGRIRSVVGFW